MELGKLLLRKLVGPAVSRTLPVVRTARGRLSRGRCFNPPRGKTYVVLPDSLGYEGAAQITTMLDRLWYEQDRDWEVVRTSADEPLHEKIRHENLIVLGAPGQNTLVNELMRDHPEMFQSVRYHGSGTEGTFLWLDRAFRPDEETDFALLAIKRNPFASDRRKKLVLISGLGDAGTLAAAGFYANDRYAPDRQDAQREAGTLQGNLEILLRVSHSAGHAESLRVRAARRSDGIPFNAPALPASDGERLLPAPRASLARIYDSLEQHRRRVVQTDLRFTLTVTRDFSLRMEEEVTIGAEHQDVVVFTKKLRGTPLTQHEDIGFRAEVVDGDEDIGYLLAEVLQSERRFLLIPLPALIAGGRPRRIRVSALWPRACHTLQADGGEDLNSVEISEHVGPNVDRVTVTIRFDVPDARFQVFERFPLDNMLESNDGTRAWRRTYGIDSPYQLQLADVSRGTTLEFRIVRVAQAAAVGNGFVK